MTEPDLDSSTLETDLRPRRPMGRAIQASALPVVWVVLIIVFSVIDPGTFFTTPNFTNILNSQATLVFITLALLLPLSAGDFDLSIASNAGLAAMIVAVLNVHHHVPIVTCVVVALAAGIGIGLVNAAIVVGFGVDAFIATLGSGSVIAGLTAAISSENTISGVSSGLVNLVNNTWWGLSHCFVAALALTLILWYVAQHTMLGRRVLFVGLGPTVAQLSGIRVNRTRVTTLATSGFLAALGGVTYVGLIGAADPSSSTGFLLPAFAAMFLGSTTIMPGRFNAWGTTIAVYFLATGSTGLELMGVANWVQQIFYGGILVIAVAAARGGSRIAGQSRNARAK